MKNTTKLAVAAVAAVALFFTTTFNAQAQSEDSKALRFGVGISAGVPTGNLSSSRSVVLGADLRLQQDFTSNISGILSAGFNSHTFKDSYGGGSLDMVPVKAGAKFFVAESIYLQAELGAGFVTNKNSTGALGGGTYFLYSPAVGYAWDNGLDLGVRYEGASKNGLNLGQVALRLAYGWRL